MPFSNAIFGSLGPGNIAALRALLKVIQLEQKTVLFEPGELVYFPIDGHLLVVTLSDGQVAEAAMVGNDGVVGASSALDGKIAFSRAIMQLSGKVAVCDASSFKSTVLVQALSPRSFAMSRPFSARRNNRPRAWQIITSRPDFADGCYAREICREATIFRSLKNSWLKC
jgi:hypothetical protein